MEQFYYVCTLVCFAVFGLCIGSFLNVVCYRLPRGMNLAKPSSHCPHCGHPIAWYDNIPLLSFLILRAKCRHCGAPISPRYFFLELFNCLLWLACAFTFYAFGIGYALVCALALSVLLSMALCDAENMWIPDSLQASLLIVAAAGVLLDPVHGWQQKLWGLAFGGGFFLLFYLLSFPLFGREGLGFGDVKLMAFAGLLLGWKQTAVAVFAAIVAALAGLICKKIGRRTVGAVPLNANGWEFAFAPYLAFGCGFAIFFADVIINWYNALLA